MLRQSLTGQWQFRRIETEPWLPARVPGGVHTDLLAAGQIPDPFVADYEKQVRWVAEADWVYRRTFIPDPDLPAHERIYLVCDGLDTLAEVRLNGELLGRTDNMFRRYRWEIRSRLRPGKNDLEIIFRSPVNYISARQAARPLPGVSQAIPGGPYLRKAPCHFGWDWGPQLPPIGIWQDLRLEGYRVARLADVHLRQHHQPDRVTLEAVMRVECWQQTPLTATLRVTGPGGEELTTQARFSGDTQTLQLPLASPQLWWPNGYGQQPLYQVEVTLANNHRTLDYRTYQVGLRTLELRQEADEWGQSFIFIVNDVPIFAKGANWIPADSFPTRVTNDQLEQLIHDAVAAHFNMLRVWGGGFYGEERFYDLCDRYGLLVWQDFVFACSVYPLDDEAFVANVHREVVENIRRLRHRASLALWCGNNEMEWMWDKEPGWDTPDHQDLKAAYEQFFYHTLAEWCAAEDPDHAYWPSSPSSNRPFQDPNGQQRGNTHYWAIWHERQPFTAYRDQYPRFMSEFGFQSLPPLETIQTYASEADWNMTSYIMEHHQRHRSGNGLIIAQMADTFRMPKDFPSLVYLSLVLQAEGIRYGVEHWRRHRRRVGGILYWQLNDCWPVASWSSLDYFGRWKALHYAARRFYAPILFSIEDKPPHMSLYVTSDLMEPWLGTIRWSLETLGGEVLESGQEAVSAAPLATTPVRPLNFSNLVSDENCRQVVFIAELWQEKYRQALSLATFAPNKHLSLVQPELTVEINLAGDQVVIELSARSLARFVELKFDGVDVVFSDNYFDVPAGRTVTVTCPRPQGWTIDQARTALRVRSLYDSFA